MKTVLVIAMVVFIGWLVWRSALAILDRWLDGGEESE